MTDLLISHDMRTVPNDRLRRLWATNPPLVVLSLAALALLVVTAGLALLDPRLITGAPAWIKPLKFAISTVFYTLTLVWLLGFVEGRRRLVGLVGWATTVALVVELALIVLQVIRGVSSHFNNRTPFDAAVFSTMAGFIVLTWAMCLLALVLLSRQRMADRAFAWSLRLGLVTAVLGMGLAFLMTAPTPVQLAALQTGAGSEIIGAHTVGAADGGPGLPFLGWSTVGGDLRIAHFVGLHGLQVLPLLGYATSRFFASRLSSRRRTLLVWTAGLGYLGLMLLLAWQALRGQPLLQPDRLTVGALAALVGAVVVAAGLVIATAPAKGGRHD